MKYEAPYGVSDPNASYINGNPSTGTMGSIPPAASIENPQREIVNFITDARLTPTDADLHQLGEAIQSNGVVYCDDQGTVNQLVITLAPPVTALIRGMVFIVKSPNSNTGPSTLKVNSLAPVPIVNAVDQSPLGNGQIAPGAMEAYAYDGANFQMAWSQRQPGAPIYLTAPKTYYVNGATGNDSYDGTLATYTTGVHGPFRTIQKACNQIPLYNMNGYDQTIYVADGAYAGFGLFQANGAGSVHLIGNTTTPANCSVFGTNMTAIAISCQCGVSLNGFKVANSGPQTPADAMSGVGVGNAGTKVYMDAMEFGTCTGAQILVLEGGWAGNFTANIPWKISGGAQTFLQVYYNSTFISNSVAGPNITITGSLTYSNAFLGVSQSSTATFIMGAITGYANVFGPKFTVYDNSTIVTYGGGLNYYPGSTAGTASPTSGGYYT